MYSHKKKRMREIKKLISRGVYDKDGENNDFSLGQGQTPVTELGNWMNYAFFGIGENGSIKQYLLGKNKTPYIATIPGGYSKAFDRKKKNILLLF